MTVTIFDGTFASNRYFSSIFSRCQAVLSGFKPLISGSKSIASPLSYHRWAWSRNVCQPKYKKKERKKERKEERKNEKKKGRKKERKKVGRKKERKEERKNE
jgi:hypothetical protein